MKVFYAKIILAILVLIGFCWLIRVLLRESSNESRIVLNPDHIPTQEFIISADADTILKGEKGTILKIDRETFRDCLGKPVSGQIKIMLKEIVSKADIILSGLSTTTNGKPLESGGILYLNAKQKNRGLCICDTAKIGVIVPAKKILKDMKLYKGRFFDRTITINWTDPEDLLNNPGTSSDMSLRKANNTDELTEVEAYRIGSKTSDTLLNVVNQFWYDYNHSSFDDFTLGNRLNYVFETNNLGWLNIDRLPDYDKNKETKLTVSIQHRNDFRYPVVKLIFKHLDIYVDGFEAGSNHFVFGKNYEEGIFLPAGEPVVVLAVAQCKGKPYIAMQEFILGDNHFSVLNLKATTMHEIESMIKEKF